VAEASAGPYANLHLAPDRKPCQHPTTHVCTGWMSIMPPTNSVKAFKTNTHTHTHKKKIFTKTD